MQRIAAIAPGYSMFLLGQRIDILDPCRVLLLHRAIHRFRIRCMSLKAYRHLRALELERELDGKVGSMAVATPEGITVTALFKFWVRMIKFWLLMVAYFLMLGMLPAD